MNVQTLHNAPAHTYINSLDELIPAHIWAHGGIIKVVSEHHDIKQLQLILPALARLSHDGRWLAWVGSPFRCTSENLQQLSTDPYRLLQVYPGKHSNHLSILGKALSTGRCSAVMAWAKQHDEQELQQLKKAARKGNAIGVLLSQGGNPHISHSQADLTMQLQYTSNRLMITLQAPHFTGQRVYHLHNTSYSEHATLANIHSDTMQQSGQLSFF